MQPQQPLPSEVTSSVDNAHSTSVSAHIVSDVLYNKSFNPLGSQPAQLIWDHNNVITLRTTNDSQTIFQITPADIDYFRYEPGVTSVKLKNGKRHLVRFNPHYDSDLLKSGAGPLSGAAGPLAGAVGAAYSLKKTNDMVKHEAADDHQWWLDNLQRFGTKTTSWTMAETQRSIYVLVPIALAGLLFIFFLIAVAIYFLN